MWANSWTFREALEAAANHLGLTSSNTPIPRLVKPKPQPKKDWTIERKRLEKLWNEAPVDIFGLNSYFGFRGFTYRIPTTSLKIHPKLAYYHEGGEVTYHPTMLARIVNGDALAGLHKTYLADDYFGKASVPSQRKIVKCADTVSGGSIQLFEAKPDKPLNLCEGIETGLAVHLITGQPVWSCISTTMLQKVEIPKNIESVVICADKDRNDAGQRSAEKLAERLIQEGREVKISLPPIEIPDGEKGVDWLDYLNNKEVEYV